MVQIGNDYAEHIAIVLVGIGHQVNVGLSAALVIGIAGIDTIARSPFVEVSPCQGVVYVALLRVNGL